MYTYKSDINCNQFRLNIQLSLYNLIFKLHNKNSSINIITCVFNLQMGLIDK